ncbi:LYR motif-containing protein 9 isoform X2 [Equus asinus]|uniref:LYR motif-containing protein 9 isoform X2 n=1 Tax=Equus asinus TaxID=9793 RepID=UPI0038F66F41
MEELGFHCAGKCRCHGDIPSESERRTLSRVFQRRWDFKPHMQGWLGPGEKGHPLTQQFQGHACRWRRSQGQSWSRGRCSSTDTCCAVAGSCQPRASRNITNMLSGRVSGFIRMRTTLKESSRLLKEP